MGRYILKRSLQAIPLILIVSIICFVLLQLTTDPLLMYNVDRLTSDDVVRLRQQLGLDRPIYVQYFAWLKQAALFDWGYSLASHRPVVDVVAERLPRTILLGATSELLVVLVALAVAIYSAWRPYSVLDNLLSTITLAIYSMPIFLLALMLIYLFAVYFRQWGLPYLPTGGDIWNPNDIKQLIRHLILPVISLAGIHAAAQARYLRSSMLDVMNSDYIRIARGKGLRERAVLLRHALKNAAIPLVTLIGLDLPRLVAGAVVTETVFSWPGMGLLFWEGIGRGDYPVVMAVLLLVSLIVIAAQLLVDISYTFLDPRIRYS
ncbi:MAG: ABC transporter permease [Anaerolineales bacterium]|nr:ABC transporter permease [Anaerolineales bacterium]